jgi:hypothetical protein
MVLISTVLKPIPSFHFKYLRIPHRAQLTNLTIPQPIMTLDRSPLQMKSPLKRLSENPSQSCFCYFDPFDRPFDFAQGREQGRMAQGKLLVTV